MQDAQYDVITPCASVKLLGGGIIYTKMHPSTDPISEQGYCDLLEKTLPLIRGKKMVALIDIRGIDLNMSNEAKQLAANHKELNECRIAEAILTDSLAIRIAANFYFKFFRPPIPMKLFSKEEKAMEWLSQFPISENQGSQAQSLPSR